MSGDRGSLGNLQVQPGDFRLPREPRSSQSLAAGVPHDLMAGTPHASTVSVSRRTASRPARLARRRASWAPIPTRPGIRRPACGNGGELLLVVETPNSGRLPEAHHDHCGRNAADRGHDVHELETYEIRPEKLDGGESSADDQ